MTTKECPVGQDGAEVIYLNYCNNLNTTKGTFGQASPVISNGKYAGKSFQWLILKRPEYVHWWKSEAHLNGPALSDLAKLEREIRRFDWEPFKIECNGRSCSNRATWCAGYSGNPTNVSFWCQSCDPYQSGTAQNRLWIIRDYEGAQDYVNWSCGGNHTARREIVDQLAAAKRLRVPM